MDIDETSKRLIVGGPFPQVFIFQWNLNGERINWTKTTTPMFSTARLSEESTVVEEPSSSSSSKMPSGSLMAGLFTLEMCIDLVMSAKVEILGSREIRWIRQGRACLIAQSDGSVVIYHVRRKIILVKLVFPLRRTCSSLTILSDEQDQPLEFLCTHEDGTFSLWSLFHK
jgi:hypothetical protein